MVAISDAYLTAVDSVAELLARPEVAAAWESPSALAEWSVGGLAGHLAGQAFAGVSLIEADSSDLAPIALDEHYERVALDRRRLDDDVSVGIRSGGDANAAAGPRAPADPVGRGPRSTARPAGRHQPGVGRCSSRGRGGRFGATTSW